jgi:hypothetical protein
VALPGTDRQQPHQLTFNTVKEQNLTVLRRRFTLRQETPASVRCDEAEDVVSADPTWIKAIDLRGLAWLRMARIAAWFGC